MYRSRRMIDGSLKLMETARISRSYTEMTSTFPWHKRVTAFCQWTILSGSYDAFSSSVCSIVRSRVPARHVVYEFCPTPVEGSRHLRRKHLDTLTVNASVVLSA